MNWEEVERIVGLLAEYPVSEISVERDGHRVVARRGASSLSAPVAAEAESLPTPEAAAPEPAPEPPVVLTAPMVGVFYYGDVPVRQGTVIAPGQSIGSIESMKLLIDVPAEHGGRVAAALIEDGTPVEYGQPLFRLTSV